VDWSALYEYVLECSNSALRHEDLQTVNVLEQILVLIDNRNQGRQ
jgi:hypothetical protein